MGQAISVQSQTPTEVKPEIKTFKSLNEILEDLKNSFSTVKVITSLEKTIQDGGYLDFPNQAKVPEEK